MHKPGSGQPGFDGLLHVGAKVGVGQFGRFGGKGGVGFERQLIAGEVRRCVAEGLFEIVQRLFELLPRQAVHEVEIEIVEMLRCQLDGQTGFAGVVNAPKRGQMRGMEALDAEREAIHSGGAVSSKARGFRCAGIGFQRDFCFRR